MTASDTLMALGIRIESRHETLLLAFGARIVHLGLVWNFIECLSSLCLCCDCCCHVFCCVHTVGLACMGATKATRNVWLLCKAGSTFDTHIIGLMLVHEGNGQVLTAPRSSLGSTTVSHYEFSLFLSFPLSLSLSFTAPAPRSCSFPPVMCSALRCRDS